ncbi:glutamate racemase [Reinekea thalattae]|uniref:Glutamate racemase n=2 Tax=Reinekea thalattae TaxID=2593301 RepID=A0A5C8ZAE1_9GAMM|nr:glutamate racemase [Reinekea thalattae]
MIGVFDSGLGGLTVLTQLKIHYPKLSLLYVADQHYSPYGNKPAELIVQRCRSITQWLVDQGCSVIVVACNTATALAIELLREEFDLPIVGVEPGVKPAALSSQCKKIAVLATENTVSSQRYSELLSRFLPSVTVVSQRCVGLADAIEHSSEQLPRLIKKYCQPLVAEGVDHIVLGCTHYPLITDQILTALGKPVAIVDTGRAVANYAFHCYQQLGIQPRIAETAIYTTSAAEQCKAMLLNYELLQPLRNVPVYALAHSELTC